MKSNDLLITVSGFTNLFVFNEILNEFQKSDISSSTVASDGYGTFVVVDGAKELASIFCQDSTMYFYFREKFRLDDEKLSVMQKDGFFKNDFKVYLNNFKKIDIKYKQLDVDDDIFLEVKQTLNIRPRSEMIKFLENWVSFFSEKDMLKRQDINWNKNIWGCTR